MILLLKGDNTIDSVNRFAKGSIFPNISVMERYYSGNIPSNRELLCNLILNDLTDYNSFQMNYKLDNNLIVINNFRNVFDLTEDVNSDSYNQIKLLLSLLNTINKSGERIVTTIDKSTAIGNLLADGVPNIEFATLPSILGSIRDNGLDEDIDLFVDKIEPLADDDEVYYGQYYEDIL